MTPQRVDDLYLDFDLEEYILKTKEKLNDINFKVKEIKETTQKNQEDIETIKNRCCIC